MNINNENITKKSELILNEAKRLCDELMEEYTVSTVPIAGVFCYIQGVLLLGYQHMYEITNDERYSDFVKKWVDYHLTDKGAIVDYEASVPWFHFGTLDYRQPGVLMFDLYDKTHDEKYRTALEFLVETMRYYPINSKGSFWHNVRTKNEVWLDGLYMISPLITRYAARFDKPKLFDIVATQIINMYENMQDENGLLLHGWCEDKSISWAKGERGLSETVWARSCGWVVAAIVDILDYFPKTYEKYNYIVEILNVLLARISKYQDSDGLWHQVLDKPERSENPQESSATCLFLYAAAKSMRCGYTDDDYSEMIEKGMDGIINNVIKNDENGKITISKICAGLCIVTGEYDHYINNAEYVDNDSHGTGVFIQMCTEIYALYHR